MDLVIVESPAKSKTIEKYLGKDYKVVSSVGHIRDLSTTGKYGLGIDIDNDIKPNYEAMPSKKKVINELKKLGITREVDLRANGDGNNGQAKFDAAYYDVSTSDTAYLNCRHYNNPNAYCFANPTTYQTDQYLDVKITNYQVNPVATTYFSNTYSDNFDDLKATMKAVMRQIVNHENIYFHCTIGTDRTGTLAYFLEGLLGVSEEDRLRDYDMTYYFGLTNRSRFHNNLSTSSINPRFYAMYKSYPTVSDIEAFYKTRTESDDNSLLAAFRQEMILSN